MAASSSNASQAASEAKMEELSARIDQLKSDIGSLTEAIGDLGRLEGNRLSAKARLKGEQYRAAGEDKLNEIHTAADGYYREGERLMREQPAAALGLAAAVGFLFGFVTRK